MLESANRLRQRDKVSVIAPVPMFDNEGRTIIGHRIERGRVSPIFEIAGGRAAVLQRTPANQDARKESDGAPAPPTQLVPFVEAAKEHFEGAFLDTSQLIDAGTHAVSADIPSYGFAKAIWLLVSGSAGTLGAGVLATDYPFSALDQIQLVDTNGVPFFGPFSGYTTYVHNLVGGYAWKSDVTNYPSYVGTINFQFYLRIPIEITAWDAYGALGNLNASNPYRIRLNVTPSSTNYSTAPTTPATVRIRAYLEAWSQPPRVDHLGRPVQTEPPAHGTTQYWSQQIKAIAAGANTTRLERMGNLIRELVFIARNNTLNAGVGTRDDSVFPDPIELDWDSHQVSVGEPQIYRKITHYERYGFALPTGVFVYDYIHDQDGHPGSEDRHLYIPTVQATRLQLVGSSATAGNLEIYTNDIMPVPGVVGAPVAGITERGTG